VLLRVGRALARVAPFSIRQRLHRLFPPEPLGRHVSAAVARALEPRRGSAASGAADSSSSSSSSSSDPSDASKMFAPDGRCLAPFADVPTSRFEDLVGHPVRDRSLYIKALTAPSALAEDRVMEDSYERLEFLGDAVISLVVREEMYGRHPRSDENMLTRMEQNVTNGRMLATFSRHLQLDKYLLLNLYYMRGRNVNERFFEDAFEALVGALYLDAGLEPARAFVHRVMSDVLDEEALVTDFNFKVRGAGGGSIVFDASTVGTQT
jgi:23S rRNA maturation mini-RNase III